VNSRYAGAVRLPHDAADLQSSDFVEAISRNRSGNHDFW
jgi:hypothetical protein